MSVQIKNKAFKFRIYPNKKQEILLAKSFGCVRFVFNHYLAERNTAYEKDKISLSYQDNTKDLVSLKKENEFLKEVDSIALQQSLRHLDTAFQNFFKNKKSKHPKFKSKKNNHCSYSTICVNNNIRLEDGYIILPKLAKMKIKQHREIPEDYILKSATISKTPTNKYFVSILYEYAIDIEPVIPRKTIGLDFSMSDLYVSSEKDVIVDQQYLHRYRKSMDKLAKEQRKLSHCQKGSNRYEKQRMKVAKVHEHIANQRKNYLHQESRKIANSFDIVCIESIDMQAMSQVLHFGKSVTDNGWGMFTQYLMYKLEDMGKKLTKVDKWFPSSKTCHICGYVNKELTLATREWICPHCHTKHERDFNASINIKQEGIRLTIA